MPDIINSVNSAARYGQNPTNAVQQTNSTQAQPYNVADPTRVNRPDQSSNRQGQQQDSQGNSEQVRYDSNFQTFLQQLQSTPSPGETLTALLAGRDGAVPAGDNVAQQLSAAMRALNMGADELVQYLTDQTRSNSRFTGPLFNLLRNAYGKASSPTMQNDVLQFLRTYLDYASTSHIEGRLTQNLAQTADAMPERWGMQLQELNDLLKDGIAAGNREGNAALIRKSVIPLMSKYVDATHDMGLPRRLLSLLTLDLTRYENGSKENLLQTFHQLRGYSALKNQLGGISDQMLLELLKNDGYSPQSPANQFANHLASAASQALRGGGSAETQQAMQQLVATMLMNESVYLPINHYLLPLDQSFADLWVDPNDKGKGGSGGGQEQSSVRLLLQINAPGYGHFDVVMQSQDKDVDVQVACPEGASAFIKEIQQAVSQILTNSGLNPTNVRVRGVERPVTVSQVFPQVFEGSDCINVKV
jgi:hypothetical protein